MVGNLGLCSFGLCCLGFFLWFGWFFCRFVFFCTLRGFLYVLSCGVFAGWFVACLVGFRLAFRFCLFGG